MAAASTPFEAALAARAATLPPARAAAAAGFSGLPHRRMEAWKWSDVRAALRDDLAPAHGAPATPSLFAEAGAFEIAVVNGEARWSAPPPGVSVRRDEEASALDHPMARLAAAFAGEGLRIEIAGVVAAPIHIRRFAGAGAAHGRASISLGQGAAATVIESFEGEGAYFSNSAIEYALAPGAALTRIVFQDGGADGVETAYASLALHAGACVDQTALLFGGRLARVEARIDCLGPGTRVDLRTAAAISGDRHSDATSLIAHHAVGGRTRQLHRAALRDRARGVFQGKFLVARGGQKTDAEMRAGALLLSDAAEANHKPELEIYADDVTCAHGATAGALDAQAIFYMRQRGLSERAARALLVEAFLAEAFDGGLAAGALHILRARLARWLEAA